MTGPNGQAADRDLAVQTRDASRRLRALGTLCYDLADELLSTGPRPGSAQRLYDLACDARDLSGTLVMLEHRRDNQNDEPKGQQR